MIAKNLQHIKNNLPENVTLVAVSKTKPVLDLQQAYNAGQRIFGENKVQEMTAKFEELPKDIQWHMIGHLQSNKVKYIAPYVGLIHGVDSINLLEEINKQAAKNNRIIDVLLQVHIAEEESKFGFDADALTHALQTETLSGLKNISIKGLMGMATFTDDAAQIQKEFRFLKKIYDQHAVNQKFSILSMGMSGDYELAVACGSTMVRIGSSIFGNR